MTKIKELNLEELKSVAGGSIDEHTYYVLDRYLEAIIKKYNMWASGNPNAADEEKYQMAVNIIDEVYNCLSPEEKKCIDICKTEMPRLWAFLPKMLTQNSCQ